MYHMPHEVLSQKVLDHLNLVTPYGVTDIWLRLVRCCRQYSSMLPYFQWDTSEHDFVKFKSKYNTFLSGKFPWNGCLQNGHYFIIMVCILLTLRWAYDYVSKWKHFPCDWPFVRGIVTDGFPSQRPVTRSFDVYFDLRLNKRLSKQIRRRWCETPSYTLWRHCKAHIRIPGTVFKTSRFIRAI